MKKRNLLPDRHERLLDELRDLARHARMYVAAAGSPAETLNELSGLARSALRYTAIVKTMAARVR